MPPKVVKIIPSFFFLNMRIYPITTSAAPIIATINDMFIPLKTALPLCCLTLLLSASWLRMGECFLLLHTADIALEKFLLDLQLPLASSTTFRVLLLFSYTLSPSPFKLNTPHLSYPSIIIYVICVVVKWFQKIFFWRLL